MQKKEDLWYRVGYALEIARSHLPAPKDAKKKTPAPLGSAGAKVRDALFTVGAGTVLTRLLPFWPRRRPPGLFRLARAGAAGAAAAFLAEIIRPALLGTSSEGSLEEEITDILLSGAGRGLLYAGVVEPRIPAHALIQGAAYGALEYALTPWGGLDELVGSGVPHKKLPVLSVLLQKRRGDEEFLEHLAFGIALALLYRD